MDGDKALSARVRWVAARQDGVVTRAQCRELGVSAARLRRLVRQGEWVGLARGTYWVMAGGEPPLRTRVRSALLSCCSDAAACGTTAVRLHGLQGVPRAAERTVHVACPRPGPARPGVALHRLSRRGRLWLPGDMPVTTVAQSVADVLRVEDRATAVSVLDSALHQGLLPGGAGDLARVLRGYPGGQRAHRLMRQADGRAESPLETRGRLVCTDAGMPPEVLQWALSDADGARYRIDLGWPSRGVGVEADGRAVHGAPEALYADRHRQNALLAAHRGLVLLRFTWRDALRPERFLATLRQALAGGG